jgi:centromeric protein E
VHSGVPNLERLVTARPRDSRDALRASQPSWRCLIMSATYSTPAKRPVLSSFAPKRSHSRDSGTPVVALPGIFPAAAKRLKAAISLEARQRTKPPVSALPPKKLTINDAPRSPRLHQSDVKKAADESEMDVSRVDPEDVLLDYSNIDMGDADNSAEMDESFLKGLDRCKEDKVIVSIRYEASL